ncbi:MAG: hypothetical protein ISR65_01795 [Bacteriovoracaceae bacterium]|nr:hypothetical protein [Bacteriovoracaceae bacterium]
MYQTLSKFKVLFIIATIILTCNVSETSTKNLQLRGLKRSNNRIIQSYLRLHDKFRRKLCPGGTEEKFNRLRKSFVREGYWIPLLPNGSFDSLTIRQYLPEVGRKIKWINKQLTLVKIKKHFKRELKALRRLKEKLNELLDFKKEFYKSNKDKGVTLAKSSKKMARFRHSFLRFTRSITFLWGYDFPVDHLNLRKQFEESKIKRDLQGKKKTNQIFFYRKIVEDGTSLRGKRSDHLLRTTLNTVFLSINKKQTIISENLRYDLDFLLSRTERILKKGTPELITRLTSWVKKVKRMHKFYQELLLNKKNSTSDRIEKQVSTAYALKSYVISKQAKAYKFWLKQSKLMQAIFTIETILFNEVGTLDGRGGVERRDIAQIVINRKGIDEYSQLDRNSELFKKVFLKTPLRNDNKSKWIDILFKTGEFSFTYYFIPGVVRTFCPDMTRRGRRLRRENLSIAVKGLKRPSQEFQAVRYFSRSAMVGRIDMAQIWDDFVSVPQKPGVRLRDTKKLSRSYKTGNYRFLYSFDGRRGKKYDVIQIRNREYIKERGQHRFFRHRSPHKFRYFKNVKIYK